MYEVRWAYSFYEEGDKIGAKQFTSLWDAYNYARGVADIDTWAGLFVVRGTKYHKVCLDLLGKRREKMWKDEEYKERHDSI